MLQRLWAPSIAFVMLASSAGCARLVFDGPDAKGVRFYEPQPMIVRTVAENCAVSNTLMMTPNLDSARTVRTTTGIGSNKLEVSFENGMITSLGQTTDTQIPQTLEALSTLTGTVLNAGGENFLPNGEGGKPTVCQPVFEVFRIDAQGTVSRTYPPQGQ